jgi:hypothetical protein
MPPKKSVGYNIPLPYTKTTVTDAPPRYHSSMAYKYFCAYRYNRRGNVFDGNTVVTSDRPILTADHIRDTEKMIATELGVAVSDFGLTSVSLLGETED